MTEGLPDPGSLEAAAAEADGSSGINLLVSGAAEISVEAIEHDDNGYRGPGAGTAGRLAAATAAVDRLGAGRLQYPNPEFDAAGPWVVVEPLAGHVATVSRGRAQLTLELAPPTGHPDARLRAIRDQLDRLLEAARPRHDRYPVHRDEFGAFTPGLTAFELESVALTREFSATFTALTTPDTDRETLGDRFRGVDGVEAVEVAVETPVERASPSPGLREAVEAASVEVVDDWLYEWLPKPTAFARVHSDDKIALGTGTPGDENFTPEAFATCRDLIAATLTTVEGAPT